MHLQTSAQRAKQFWWRTQVSPEGQPSKPLCSHPVWWSQESLAPKTSECGKARKISEHKCHWNVFKASFRSNWTNKVRFRLVSLKQDLFSLGGFVNLRVNYSKWHAQCHEWLSSGQQLQYQAPSSSLAASSARSCSQLGCPSLLSSSLSRSLRHHLLRAHLCIVVTRIIPVIKIDGPLGRGSEVLRNWLEQKFGFATGIQWQRCDVLSDLFNASAATKSQEQKWIYTPALPYILPMQNVLTNMQLCFRDCSSSSEISITTW